MLQQPSPDDMRLAADWLRAYESDDENAAESDKCTRVADWLDAQAAAKELRDACRESGVPVALVKRRLQGS